MKVLPQKKYQDHIPYSFAYKLVWVDDKFSKLIVANRSENAAFKLIEVILKDYNYCERVVKKNIWTKIWSGLKKNNNNFNQVTRVRFVKTS